MAVAVTFGCLGAQKCGGSVVEYLIILSLVLIFGALAGIFVLVWFAHLWLEPSASGSLRSIAREREGT